MLYRPPEVWFVGSVMLKHTVAFILILLHIWTTFSIHKTLGEYGWFFGDFFIDSLTTPTKQTSHPTLSQGPTYTGLYRFLNHPNAWAAAASAWGVTVVTGSPHVLLVTVLGQFSGWCFVFLVEAPHMKRRYGDLVRKNQNLVDEFVGSSGSSGHGSGVGINGLADEFVYVRPTGRNGNSVASMRGLRRRIGGGSGVLGSRRVMSDVGVRSQGGGGSSAFNRVGSGGDWVARSNNSSPGRTFMFSSEEEGEGVFADDYDFDDQGIMMKGSSAVSGGLAGQRRSVDDEEGVLQMDSGSDGDDENDEHDISPTNSGGVGMSRSFSNPGRVLTMSSLDRLSASLDSCTPPPLTTHMSRSFESGSYMSKTMSSGSLKKVKSPIATVVQEAVNQAKPKIDKIVTDARNIVKSNVEKFAGSSNTQRFQLGTPITIQFTCARETLKRRDWIGIYRAGENLSTEVTTSKSYSRWMFLTATVKNEDDDTVPLMTKIPVGATSDVESPGSISSSPRTAPLPALDEPRQTRSARQRTASLPMEQKLLFGKTMVQVRPSDEDQGLRIVTGNLCFRRGKIPWQVGTYEARYHYDGGYSVVTISKPFEIVAECFQWMDDGNGGMFGANGGLEANEKEIYRIEAFLRVHVERCVDVDVLGQGHVPLDVNEDILARVEMDDWIADLSKDYLVFDSRTSVFIIHVDQFRTYRENVAKRIVYGIKQMFGIEFSWHVVGYMGTVRLLARRIFEAKQALCPSPPPPDLGPETN
ncbi:UNVERIFIED_CONTAM: phosphatidylethanolamine N-methyltransferase [Siphonaria sp. JEL0065]|nr:phosphatidylethanolamine N-methyltransferase [Siphonaria sp. JEL0065]